MALPVLFGVSLNVWRWPNHKFQKLLLCASLFIKYIYTQKSQNILPVLPALATVFCCLHSPLVIDTSSMAISPSKPEPRIPSNTICLEKKHQQMNASWVCPEKYIQKHSKSSQNGHWGILPEFCTLCTQKFVHSMMLLAKQPLLKNK